MYKKHLLSFILVVAACLPAANGYAQQLNKLTAKEKSEGWELLFNGKDLKGWHSYLESKPGKAWQVQNGAIALAKNSKSVYRDYADLVTDEEFDNFDLKVE